MVDPGELANVATGAAVIVAVGVGLVQWRQFERKRREAAAYEILHALQSAEFIRCTRQMMELPEDLSAEQLEAQGPATMDAVYQVATMFETLAAMVHRRTVDITIIDDIYGGFVRMFWRKVRPYVERTRKTPGNQGFMEWVQWLAERLEQLDRPEKRLGAYAAYRDWTP